ncbi:DUF2520 domain-containing protein [Mycoplasmatota bacterium WC44]
MNIGIIGSGSVGTTLGLYFKDNKMLINGFYNNTLLSAQESAEITNTNIYDNLEKIILNDDLIMICVNDDSIKNIVNEIIDLKMDLSNKYFCHTSGVYSSNKLIELKELGATIASLHPVLSIPDKVSQVDSLSDAYFTFEGLGNNYKELKEFFDKLFNNLIEFKGDKGLYHAAACVTSNYLNTLLSKALDMYIKSGMSKVDALKIMEPLVMGSVKNFFNTPNKSLTGPIARGDSKTVKAHIESIKELDRDDLREMYSYLGMLTTKLAFENKYINKEDNDKILEVINNEK